MLRHGPGQMAAACAGQHPAPPQLGLSHKLCAASSNYLQWTVLTARHSLYGMAEQPCMREQQPVHSQHSIPSTTAQSEQHKHWSPSWCWCASITITMRPNFMQGVCAHFPIALICCLLHLLLLLLLSHHKWRYASCPDCTCQDSWSTVHPDKFFSSRDASRSPRSDAAARLWWQGPWL